MATKPIRVAALLSFNGGFVDTAGFLGLQGLFTGHVTGNFVTLGAALVFGTHGVIAKLIALPEFIAVIALARLAGAALRRRGMDALRLFLVVKVIFLLAFFVLAVALGPFPDSDFACGTFDWFCRHRRHGDPECGAARAPRSYSADDADDRQHHPGRA